MDEDEDIEPAWPGWRSMVSGRAGVIAVVLLIVGGYLAFSLVRQQAQYNSPAHTQTVCIPLGDSSGTAPAVEPTELCVTGHE